MKFAKGDIVCFLPVESYDNEFGYRFVHDYKDGIVTLIYETGNVNKFDEIHFSLITSIFRGSF